MQKTNKNFLNIFHSVKKTIFMLILYMKDLEK